MNLKIIYKKNLGKYWEKHNLIEIVNYINNNNIKNFKNKK